MLNGHIEADAQPLVRLVKADQASLNAHWPWLRDKLLEVKATNEYPRLGNRRKVNKRELAVSLGHTGRCRWIPEQVRMTIMRGFTGQSNVELFYAWYRWELRGFIITVCNLDPIVGTPMELVIWLMATDMPHMLELAMPQLQAIALDRGCTALEHSSPRMGWQRRQKSTGPWQFKFATWRMEIS